MTQELIYLATPYTHPDPDVMEERFHLACLHAGHLMGQGVNVFCPIAHTHPIAVRCDLPRGFEFWERYDRAMIERCTKLVVVKMDGWTTSKGVFCEIGIAEDLGIPVEYVNPLNTDYKEEAVDDDKGRGD